MNQLSKTPDIPEPTTAEIKQANDALEQAYDFRLPDEEAIRFVKFVKELQQWERTSKGEEPDSTLREFTSELSHLFVALRGIEADPAELSQDADMLLKVLSFQEMKRIVREVTGMIVEHRPIPFEQSVEDKAAELLKAQYGVELDREQLGQVVQFLYRKLWYEEGLDRSLEECLDDLSEEEVASATTRHPDVREALDLTALKLGGKA